VDASLMLLWLHDGGIHIVKGPLGSGAGDVDVTGVSF
jgi:hypothetical protein